MSVLETYKVQLVGGPLADCPRWQAHTNIICGGTILDALDWQHLQREFNCTAVINLETEHSDKSKGIKELLEIPLPDDGSAKPKEWFWQAWSFYSERFQPGMFQRGEKLYLHCQMGGSRTPTMLYYLMRKMGWHPDSALNAIRTDKPGWGEHPFHKQYLASAEAAL